MEQPPDYGRAFLRMLFIVLLALALVLPPLTASEVGQPWAQIRDFLEGVPLIVWMVAGVAALVMLGMTRAVSGHVRSPRGSSQGQSADPLLAMPIEQAVAPSSGGNGLASRAMDLNLRWKVAGWLHIQTPGTECLVIDGRRVVRKTRWYLAPMQLLGRPSFVRRVLLAPKPQDIASVKTLSRDGWETEIAASVTYRVRDPKRVLSENPLSEFANLVQGVIGEHIHANTQADMLSDEGMLRRMLEDRLRHAQTLAGFEILEVPLRNVKGDERQIEVERQKAIETGRADLVQLQGANEVLQAGYQLQIDEARTRLEDWMAGQTHGREMESLRAQLASASLQELMKMVAQIASMGMNPQLALSEMRAAMSEVGHAPINAVPRLESPAESAIEAERRVLSERQADIGITHFEIVSNPENAGAPGTARIVFPDFTLHVTCPDEYPGVPPLVTVEPVKGSWFVIEIPWQPGNRLIEVATSAAMQVPFELQAREQGAQHVHG